MKNEIEVFHHYLLKGCVTLHTYRLVIQALERMESNTKENDLILDAIHKEIDGMDAKVFNQFKDPLC